MKVSAGKSWVPAEKKINAIRLAKSYLKKSNSKTESMNLSSRFTVIIY